MVLVFVLNYIRLIFKVAFTHGSSRVDIERLLSSCTSTELTIDHELNYGSPLVPMHAQSLIRIPTPLSSGLLVSMEIPIPVPLSIPSPLSPEFNQIIPEDNILLYRTDMYYREITLLSNDLVLLVNDFASAFVPGPSSARNSNPKSVLILFILIWILV
ncbi:hypothetical protein EVAR_63219_1 [Eumeta japonica]|uniref:Uncharacterized protein n=1 Tax=Eumeta variegata TaxID=151549 RepID=A0A4C1ZF16_EUMVA|nr:hypothetical protein EVAR_63219_1 [Eumeta japonica]